MRTPSPTRRTRRLLPPAVVGLLTAVLGATGLAVGTTPAHAVTDAPHCSSAGTWTPGEFNIYWFDVDQGDSQLVVGPTGRTLLVDLGETSFNSTGTNTNATKVAAQIRSICGIASGPVHLDYVMASHHHLDHIGYPRVPGDTTAYGNGLWQLLAPAASGGFGFTVGQLIDHDGGTWQDTNGNGTCDPGTSTAPSDEIHYDNAGTTSGTGARFICWLYGPASQADRADINGKVVQLTNSSTWPSLDLGTGVTSTIVEANAKGVMQADGTTPVSGDHHLDASPPSENDYSIGVRFAFGPFAYATAGDSDGEYATSANSYTYNDVESLLKTKMGTVNALRANHHGSAHSSSDGYVTSTDPQVAFISCGVNSYGHPGNRTLDAFRKVGADIFLANDPCDTTDTTGAAIDYSGTYNHNGTVHLATSGSGAGFTVAYDAGTRSYTTRASSGTGGTGGTGGSPSAVKVNEVLMAPSGTGTEWVELYNTGTSAVDLSGLYIDDAAGGGGSPRQIPAGTTIAAGGHWVMDIPSGYLNNTGAESARFLAISGGVETVYDSYSWSLGSTQYDKVFHRSGDGGAWCGTISTAVTKGTANPTTCP
ncbi:lamin tail domain-containing protein [Pedococcus sp. NPDC057267]|uniref:lamin tail domain-containing protein n=1 Tax=Pedococcus sp. NPDC057267 TaxID=3346077 RepID=UPI0036273408